MSIAEHMLMVSLMLMRQMNVIYRKSISGEWGSRLPQKSLRGSRITVLGTGDIGCTFAQRVHSFEPASRTGLCRSGKCSERSFDRIFRIDHLEDILPETDLLIMCLPETSETIGIMSKERISLTLISSFLLVILGQRNGVEAVRYLSVCMLVMTFFVTASILVPMSGKPKELLFSGSGLFHHLLIPIISTLTYLFIEHRAPFHWVWLPAVVTLVYGLIMLRLNYLDLVQGPYPFFMIKRNGVKATVIWMVALMIVVSSFDLSLIDIPEEYEKTVVLCLKGLSRTWMAGSSGIMLPMTCTLTMLLR